MRLNFYTIRTEIYVSDVVKTAFGNNKLPTWNNFMDFGEERCIPKERTDIREYLEIIGVAKYNPLEIIKKTKGKNGGG